MGKVLILFKSGNKLEIKCKKFEIDFSENNRKLKFESNFIDSYMFDLIQIESYIFKYSIVDKILNKFEILKFFNKIKKIKFLNGNDI